MTTTNHRSSQLLSKTLTATVVAVLAACASTPPRNASLDEARAAYEQASTNPTIARVAVPELQQAQQALARADRSLKEGDSKADVDHFAYLASQRTSVAVQAGRLAESDKTIADSNAQRDRILIESRTAEAEAQRNSAVQARDEAEAARRLSEQRLAAAEAARQQASLSSNRAASLEAELAAMKAQQTERGMVLTLGDVLFDTGKATLMGGAMRTVDQLATFLTNNPTRKVLIEGYTDSTGSDSTNLELSQRRADAVKLALTQRGIGIDRIDTRGLGKAYTVASNDTAAGRQLNRRVEVVFSDANGGFKMRRN